MTARKDIEDFLAKPAMAVVGLSRSGKKFGNAAGRALRSKGYRVYPIHPTADVIDGFRCYARLTDVPEPVETLFVSVPPSQALQVVRDAAQAGIRRVWLQQGAESPEVLAACQQLGLQTIARECILMFAQPTGIHNVHRWLWRVLNKLPA